MPQFNFWDEPQKFEKLCQSIESSHVQPHLTNEFFSSLRRHHELVELRKQVVNAPTQRPNTEFYFPGIGMTLSQVAFYDLTNSTNSIDLTARNANEP